MTNPRIVIFWCCIVFAATMCLESLWEIHSFPPKPAGKAPQDVHDTPEYKLGYHDGVLTGGRIMARYLSQSIFWYGDGKPHRLAAGRLLEIANGEFDPTDDEGDLVELYNMRTDELKKVLTKFKCWQKFDPKNIP